MKRCNSEPNLGEDDAAEIIKRILRTDDHYAILGVAKDVTDGELRKKYRKLAIRIHPDKCNAAGATQAFQKVSNAYTTLKDKAKRHKYDHQQPKTSSNSNADPPGSNTSDENHPPGSKTSGGKPGPKTSSGGEPPNSSQQQQSSGSAGQSEYQKSQQSNGFSGQSGSQKSQKSNGFTGQNGSQKSQQSNGFTGQNGSYKGNQSNGFKGQSGSQKNPQSNGFKRQPGSSDDSSNREQRSHYSGEFFARPKKPLSSALSNALKHWRKLLKWEHDSSEEQHRSSIQKSTLPQLVADGIALYPVRIVPSELLMGRKSVKFAHYKPDHKLIPGDPVIVSQPFDFRVPIVDGYVKKVDEEFIYVSIDIKLLPKLGELPDLNKPLVILQAFNPITHSRLNTVLNELGDPDACFGAKLIAQLFHEYPLILPSSLPPDVDIIDDQLNAAQRQAVLRSVDNRRPISIIHGPPGTGKTQTLVEIITQCVRRGERVLVCAASNTAVDNIMMKALQEHKELQMCSLRLGNPARTAKCLHKYMPDKILPDARDNQNQYKEAVQALLIKSHVVFSTLTSCARTAFPLRLFDEAFDVCIIEECAQAMEVSCWIGLTQARRCMLAGDHKQLPPTVINQQAAMQGLSISLMERLSREFAYVKDALFTVLSVQYRMNEQIMRWPSKTFYEKKLTAHCSVDEHLLSDLPYVSSSSGLSKKLEKVLDNPLVLLDTCRQMPESKCQMQHGNGSVANDGEAHLVGLYVRVLIECGVHQEDIGVISPYNLQLKEIRKRIRSHYPDVSIQSIDGSQGQEREVIILSLVRSNAQGSVGFLTDSRRLNVAVTRARRQLCVVADVDTLSRNHCLHTLFTYIRQNDQALCVTRVDLESSTNKKDKPTGTKREKQKKPSASKPGQKPNEPKTEAKPNKSSSSKSSNKDGMPNGSQKPDDEKREPQGSHGSHDKQRQQSQEKPSAESPPSDENQSSSQQETKKEPKLGEDYTQEQLDAVNRILASKSYYEVLNLKTDFTINELKKNYCRLVFQIHPDDCRAPCVHEAFKKLEHAFVVLSREFWSRGSKPTAGGASQQSSGNGGPEAHSKGTGKEDTKPKPKPSSSRPADEEKSSNNFRSSENEPSGSKTNGAESGNQQRQPRGASEPSAEKENQSHSKEQPTPDVDYTQAELDAVNRILASKTCYETLNLKAGFTEKELKQSYRKLVFQIHPDKCRAPGAHDAFIALRRAFVVLSS